ncbi:MAG TPA: hypothetical protein PLP23_13735 [Panacibacter sp.]|nr:hypothetical protein [Panacibacter sp.]
MKSVYKAFTPLLLLISSCGSGDQNSTVIQKVAPKVNYGYNIIVAVDLSNRILNNRHLQDPDVVKLITDNLKNIFQNSINVGINDKFYLTTINDEDFIEQSYSDSIFKIDLTRFKTDEVGRSNYLYHNDTGTNSLKYDIFKLNSTFASFYQAKKREKQLPADVWYFFQDKLTYPFIDTASQSYVFNDQPIVSKYKNYVILLTDGYIEAGRYKMIQICWQKINPDFLVKI